MCTRARVMDFLITHGEEKPFATTDIVEFYRGIGQEYPERAVRAAVSWLKLAGYVDTHSWHPGRQHVRLYIWNGCRGNFCGEAEKLDLHDFMRGWK